ncbi:right-handed parallel beta-helix repeat-containing protein [Anaerocolumna sp. MB42-C2]|uniref:right-handed parallel beta-helix repeat-containing protein n=1 Tax=Anaerocolumna sp. MB42-C2 TaxID=3070997 RepID=UPI0027DED6CA|nr:right-handed parallel beta-helix repeat-containing protein [Anaerocolumna sp. MB42-C2]WMJ88975.1 right-handed parallel beta-helix repeat-containing protein [Anaerocolumna sp. MB42-C2]
MNKKFFYGFILVTTVFLLFQKPIQAEARQNKVVSAESGDTSAELQKLLDYNKDGSYNLTINIPSGTYDLRSELTIYSNTTINADADAKLNRNHQKGALIANDLSKDNGGYTSGENITIKGGIWDSVSISRMNKGTESFRFIHASNITIKDATIRNVPNGSHLITFAGVKNSLIDNCKLYGYVGTMAKEAIQLDIVHSKTLVPSTQAASIKYDDLACDGIQITNCDIRDYPRAIGSHISIKGVFHKNITISNNNLLNLRETAIKLYNYQNVQISNNTISNTSVGVLVYTYLSNQSAHYLPALQDTIKEPLPTNYNIVIKNNKFYHILQLKTGDSYSWGEAIRTIGVASRPLNGVTIKNNTIADIERYGILMQQSPSSSVTNNTIKSTSNSGIYLINGCDYSVISGNKLAQNGNVKNSPAGGIGLSASSNVTVSENTITLPANDGIYLYNNSDTCAITNNTITQAKNNGIALYSESNESSVMNNIIKDYNKFGIYTSKINSAIVNSNEIYGRLGRSQDGIHLLGNNEITSNYALENNHIETTKRYGIFIDGALNCYVGSNTISNTAKNTVYVADNSDGSGTIYDESEDTDDSEDIDDSEYIEDSGYTEDSGYIEDSGTSTYGNNNMTQKISKTYN